MVAAGYVYIYIRFKWLFWCMTQSYVRHKQKTLQNITVACERNWGDFFFFFRNAKLREFRVFQMFSFAPIWDFEFIASIVTLSTFYSWMRKILSQISDSYFAIILIQNSRNVSLNDVSQILWDAVFGSTIMVKYSLSNFSVHNK